LLNENGERADSTMSPAGVRTGGSDPTIPLRNLRQIGWPFLCVSRFVNWCGHARELIPVPDDGEWVRLVPEVYPFEVSVFRYDCP